MAGNIAPNLFAGIDHVETDKEVIASKWIEIPTVVAVFKARHISGTKFKEGYGIPIIDFFIAVVREEQQAGDCPIMSKLVQFLLNKEITPKDVFDICMGLRRMLIDYLFEKELIPAPRETMTEIANLFDANLSGVLGIFGDDYAKKQARMAALEQHNKKSKQMMKIINCIKTKIMIVQHGKIILANQPFFDTVGAANLKDFQEHFTDNWSFVESVDIEPELFARDRGAWLEKVYVEDTPFKAEIFHMLARKKLTYSGRIAVLPDTDPVQYIITLQNIAAHLAGEAEHAERMSRDPLTGLYNAMQFEQRVAEAQNGAGEEESECALVVIAIPELKETNEEQGRDAGDMVVMEVAQHMAMFADETMVLGRLEGDRFGMVRRYREEQECYDWCARLHEQLNRTGKRILVSLTSCDRAESMKRLLLRGFDLIDMAGESKEVRIRTDMDVKQERLPDQEIFHECLKETETLETTLYFNELPVSSRNRVLAVRQGGMSMKLSGKQLGIVAVHAKAYFQLPGIGYAEGEVEHIESKRGIALIGNFRHVEQTPLLRKKVRVTMGGNVRAAILHEKRQIEGKVLDVNESHIAMELTRKKNLIQDSRTVVSMELPMGADDALLFESHAVVQELVKTSGGYRAVFALEPDADEAAALAHFIAHRQVELIQELKCSEV